jgi:DNA-binding protein YbaB
MAENDGSVVLGLSLDMKELKKGIADVQAELKNLTVTFKKQGEKAGKTYVEGASRGIVQLNQRLNSFVASMKALSPKMGQIGEEIASQFCKAKARL